MKKFVFTAVVGAASLAIAACDNSADDAAVTDDAMVTDTAPADTMTDTTDTTGTTTTGGTMTEPTQDLDGDGDIDADDRVTVDETGVQANVNDGNTSVRADVDENPSLTVQD